MTTEWRFWRAAKAYRQLTVAGTRPVIAAYFFFLTLPDDLSLAAAAFRAPL